MHRHLKPTVRRLGDLTNKVLSLLLEIQENDSQNLDQEIVSDLHKLKVGADTMLDIVKKVLSEMPSIKSDQLPYYLTTARHDLRTPINAIKGYGDLCMESLKAIENKKNSLIILKLEDISNIANEMLKWIDALKKEEFASDLHGQIEIQSGTMPESGESPETLFNDILVVPGATSEVGTILIVDDNTSNRDLLDTWLRNKNYKTYLAKEGSEAIALLHKDVQFDIVLLDIMMPNMNGYDVLKVIKGDERFVDLIVIMISAVDEMDSVVHCIKLGAVDYLVKPFNPYLLEARITACLQKKRLQSIYQERLITNGKLAALGNITAGIAHEIRNPLNFVNNYSEMSLTLITELNIFLNKFKQYFSELEDKFIHETVEGLTDSLRMIIKRGKQADDVINRMLSLASIHGKQFTLSNINKLVMEAFEVIYNNYEDKNKDIVFNYETIFQSDLPEVEVIQEEIFFVLLNMFSNSFYSLLKKLRLHKNFSPKITITTKKIQGNKVEIDIIDNGLGISEENKLKIFTPFFTTKPPGEGVGLGLSISHNIITQLHKGSLSFESEEGKFTKLIIIIPYHFKN